MFSFFFGKPVPADVFLHWRAGFRWEGFGFQSSQRQLDFQSSGRPDDCLNFAS